MLSTNITERLISKNSVRFIISDKWMDGCMGYWGGDGNDKLS